MAMTNIPMPNDEFDGGIVIASAWQQDDPDFGPYAALLLLLDENPDFYRVQHIEEQNGTWRCGDAFQFPNIVPAVASYQENGADY